MKPTAISYKGSHVSNTRGVNAFMKQTLLLPAKCCRLNFKSIIVVNTTGFVLLVLQHHRNTNTTSFHFPLHLLKKIAAYGND
jgi:hypothetical protein